MSIHLMGLIFDGDLIFFLKKTKTSDRCYIIKKIAFYMYDKAITACMLNRKKIKKIIINIYTTAAACLTC